jgi:TRAP-type C4-dicarboxylate transport system permease small subunit
MDEDRFVCTFNNLFAEAGNLVAFRSICCERDPHDPSYRVCLACVPGTNELVGFFQASIIALAAGLSHAVGQHVGLDIVASILLPERVYIITESIASAALLGLSTIIVWQPLSFGLAFQASGAHTAGTLHPSKHYFVFVTVISCVTISLRFLYKFHRSLVENRRHDPLIHVLAAPLPPQENEVSANSQQTVGIALTNDGSKEIPQVSQEVFPAGRFLFGVEGENHYEPSQIQSIENYRLYRTPF